MSDSERAATVHDRRAAGGQEAEEQREDQQPEQARWATTDDELENLPDRDDLDWALEHDVILDMSAADGREPQAPSGPDAWRRFWSKDTSRVPITLPDGREIEMWLCGEYVELIVGSGAKVTSVLAPKTRTSSTPAERGLRPCQ